MSLELSTLLRSVPTRVPTTIVLVVIDGLGGYADAKRGSELEEAHTPNFDRLALEGASGLVDPVGPGITPGSGPSHLALFGYDPAAEVLGRGALSAAGLGFVLHPGDVAARGNLATLDERGDILDRRAGRLPDEQAVQVVRLLREGVDLSPLDVEVFIEHEAQHRVLVVFRGPGLDPKVSDTDPQALGVPPRAPNPYAHHAERMALVVARFLEQVNALLESDPRANTLLMRGFEGARDLEPMQRRYGIDNPAGIAVYPMYQGLARLVGMEVLKATDREDQIRLLEDHWASHDYFFLHDKAADAAGEDGSFEGKVAAIEAVDAMIPAILDLGPDVLVVTGDHATPSQMAAHSWHPVPAVMWGPRVGRDDVATFGERAALAGGLGRRPTRELMGLMLANAGRLEKFGA